MNLDQLSKRFWDYVGENVDVNSIRKISQESVFITRLNEDVNAIARLGFDQSLYILKRTRLCRSLCRPFVFNVAHELPPYPIFFFFFYSETSISIFVENIIEYYYMQIH